MLNIKLEPQEAQFVISAIHNVQLMGKDAHVVSNILKKIEEPLAKFKPVKNG